MSMRWRFMIRMGGLSATAYVFARIHSLVTDVPTTVSPAWGLLNLICAASWLCCEDSWRHENDGR